MYDMIAGMKPHWHVHITREVKRDLVMWQHFIADYEGWAPIITPSTLVLHLFTDAATSVHLGWGAWWGLAWTYDSWDPQFMQNNNLSIDFLELYAVLVALQVWTSQFANKWVIVCSDNQPTVAVVNAKTSNSSSMFTLIRYLTLHCMLNNIKLTAQFVPAVHNSAADALSHLQFSRFRALIPGANVTPAPLPSFLSPLCDNTLDNLHL